MFSTRSLLFVFLILLMACKNDIDTAQQTDPEIEKLKLSDGFAAEHLYSPSQQKQGSWVAMTFDDKGRMITSDQYGALYRFNIPAIGDTSRLVAETLALEKTNPSDTSKSKLEIGYAQGLLYAFNSLYVMVSHRGDENFEKTSGLYRLQDTNGNDQYDKITLLKSFSGSGEHGPHSLKLSPDKKSIYMVAGNFNDLPPMNVYWLPPVWQEDNLFPQIKDPRGHAVDRNPPGGFIAKINPEGTTWELVSAGYRNTFDITFNEDGELFAYDSDMEWDLGMPWYRPTRICHVTSGSEFGWRTGNGKWPAHFPDNLPPLLNIGQGSPTNFVNGMGSNFPDKYRKALFASDWSFGIIYAIHLQPKGASYTATAEEFLSGTPLPLTDGLFGPDGSFYFLTGGRQLQSDLYRVYFKDNVGKSNPEPLPYSTKDVNKDFALRKQLERFHGVVSKEALALAWPKLKHEDRFVRYAARVAIEHQPLKEWQELVLQEKDPVILTHGAIALAHHGKSDVRDKLLAALSKVNYTTLAESQQLDLLRAFELVLARMGKPDAKTKKQVIDYLNPHFPARTNLLNRSLAKLLVHLEAPGAVSKTLELLEQGKDDPDENYVTSSSDLIMRNAQYGLDIANVLANIPPREQVYLAIVLSNVKTGWTTEEQERYFRWYANAFRYKGGNSYIGFINKARMMALANVPAASKDHFNEVSGGKALTQSGNDLTGLPQPKGSWNDWSVEAAKTVIDSGLVNRNYKQGKDMFVAVLCKSCHSMKGEGGSIGPDLTQIGTRFSTTDMLVHIIEPNKEVSDQYAPYLFAMKDGKSVLGKLVNEDKEKYYVSQNPFMPDTFIELSKADVTSKKLSRVSLMPPSLLNRLSGEELKDLIAYMVAAGNESHEVYTSSD